MRWVLLCLMLVACGSEQPTPLAERPGTPPKQVTGLITELQMEAGEVVAMEVETVADTFEILIDPERDYGFNLSHLEVHRRQELPVLVDIEVRGDAVYAVSILDA